MRYLFVSAPVAAHLDWGGYLPTAVGLQQRGHDVLWASGAQVQGDIERAGIPFACVAETGWRLPLPPPLKPSADATPDEMQTLRRQRALDQWLDVERVASATQQLLTVARDFHPDAILSEHYIAAAALVAEQLQLPFAVAGMPAYAPQASATPITEAQTRLATLLERTGTRGVNFDLGAIPALRSPHLHLSYWSEGWFHGLPLLAQTRHVGGMAGSPQPPDPTLPDPHAQPWVFITLGTNFNHDFAFFRMAAQAVVDMGCLPVVAHGPLIEALRDLLRITITDKAILRAHVDFAQTLPYVAAAIHHGGAGTTHALVTHGVPQIIVPHAGDQGLQAAGLRRSGAGVAMGAKEVRVESLVAALATLLPDLAPMRANAQRLRLEFAALGGIPIAADHLEHLAHQA